MKEQIVTLKASHKELNREDMAVLAKIQDSLPDSLTPYAVVAEELGFSEEYILNLLTELKKNGIIRHFGASLKHHKVGYKFNAMVVWQIKPFSLELLDELGNQAAKHPLISHCYYRPSPLPDWDYSLFTMIHGKSPEEYQEVIDWLRQTTKLNKYQILKSLAELKKTSMQYF